MASANADGNSGLISLEAMEALAQRAELIPSLPESPNLVQCFGCRSDNTGKTPAKVLLFELCGESLADVMAQQDGSMKPDEVLHVLRDIADGLMCLHCMPSGPVLHGSLEPAHVVRGVETGNWKLGSFGTAHKSLKDDPEDAASDIWQLGILLLTLLYGSTAFDQKFASKDEKGVHHQLVSSIPSQRPANNLEGRMCLLACWLLAAKPSMRPSAEQVVIAIASLGSMPAPQLGLAFPAYVRQDFKALCMALVRRTICEAIANIEGSDRRILINKYGEQAMHNPSQLPAEVKEQALSKEQAQYIRVLQSFLGSAGACLTPEAKQLSQDLARAQSQDMTPQEAVHNPTQAQEPEDLLDMGEAPKAPQIPENSAQDLLDMDDSAAAMAPVPQLIEVNASSLTPAGELLFDEPVAQASKSCDLDLLDLGAQVAPPAQSCGLDLFSSPAPPFAQPTQAGELIFNAPTASPAKPIEPNGMLVAQPPVPWAASSAQLPLGGPVQQPQIIPGLPATQPSTLLATPTASAPAKKEEPKDPFADLSLL